MFYVYQIIIWFIFLLIISSKIKKRSRRVLFSITTSFFTTLEIVAVYMTEKLIDYRFYNHLNLDAIKGHGFQFVTQSVLFAILFIFISVVFYYISKKISSSTVSKNKFFLPTVLVLFILLSMPNGIFNETYKIYEILNAEKKDFNEALKDVGISPDEYMTPENLTAIKGKNIIVISIESLEQGFLGNNFDGIAPNLARMSNKWTFYNQMPVSPGGTWTAGSLYSYIVGMPAFFKGQGNAFFQGTTNVKLTGLGHILNQAGYVSKYLIGNSDFAGTSDILDAYGIPTVSHTNTVGKYPKVPHGLHDYDLFREAKLQIDKFKKDKEKPFALFLSTINTHFPNGIYDKRMEKIIPKRENDLEFSVSAVDYLINDFMIYLEKKNLLNNTAIFIFPDHTLMGGYGAVHDKLRISKRGLYLITNIDSKKLPRKTENTLYKIDLTRMIIDGAGIETNAKFLVDFIKSDDINTYLKKNRVRLTTLNSASVERKSFKNSIEIKIVNKDLLITSDNNYIRHMIVKKNEIIDMTFNKEMVFIEKKKNMKNVFTGNAYDMIHNRLHIIVYIKNGKIDLTYLGNKQSVGIYKKDDMVEYNSKEINTIISSNLIGKIETNNQVRYENIKKANKYGKNRSRFIAHAGGKIKKYKYTNSLEALNLSYEKGFRLFELDIIKTSDNVFVAAHDWKYWSKVTGYKGVLPPDRKTFLEQRIYKEYTPMDIDSINKWFKKHSNAILVTDKVNTPIEFSKKFIDKNRLMMELFTWNAVKEGISMNIKSSMPTGSILKKIKGDKVAYLKKLGITDIASSCNIVNKQKDLVTNIVNAGINIYAFHLNRKKGENKNEKYIVCKERTYFYGMYADDWDFKSPINCP